MPNGSKLCRAEVPSEALLCPRQNHGNDWRKPLFLGGWDPSLETSQPTLSKVMSPEVCGLKKQD